MKDKSSKSKDQKTKNPPKPKDDKPKRPGGGVEHTIEFAVPYPQPSRPRGRVVADSEEY